MLKKKKQVGATRDRNGDFQIFSLTLSQLSYHPTIGFNIRNDYRVHSAAH
jgi:hypothetical protein